MQYLTGFITLLNIFLKTWQYSSETILPHCESFYEGEKITEESDHAKFLRQKSIKNNMKTAKNRSGKGILVIDIDDENQSNHDDFIKICGKCEKVATHFCQTCNENLCKFCIIDHYKNPDFTKDHEMIPI